MAYGRQRGGAATAVRAVHAAHCRCAGFAKPRSRAAPTVALFLRVVSGFTAPRTGVYARCVLRLGLSTRYKASGRPGHRRALGAHGRGFDACLESATPGLNPHCKWCSRERAGVSARSWDVVHAATAHNAAYDGALSAQATTSGWRMGCRGEWCEARSDGHTPACKNQRVAPGAVELAPNQHPSGSGPPALSLAR